MDPAVAALAGALIGLISAIAINASQRRLALETERQRAFGSYLGALYPVVAELRDMPPNQEPDLVERLIDLLSTEAAGYIRTRKAVAALGDAQFVRQDRLSDAVARVQLLEMPPKAVRAFNRANAYIEDLGEERTEDLKAEWSSVFAELHEAAELLTPRITPWWRILPRKRGQDEITTARNAPESL